MYYISIDENGKIIDILYMSNSINDIEYLGWDKEEKEKSGAFLETIPEEVISNTEAYLYIDNKFIVNPDYDMLSYIKESKELELSDTCSNTIYQGIPITLSDGSTQHFTLTEQDQLNLSGIGLKLLMGAQQIAWHEDDITKECQYYSAEDAQKIIATLTTFKEYHITYFRDLRIYVYSLNTVEEVKAIEYGFELPEEFKSQVLKDYEQLLKGE
jgi:hypothetical protein